MLSKVKGGEELKISIFYAILLLLAPPLIKVYTNKIFKIEFLVILFLYFFLFYKSFFKKKKLIIFPINFLLLFLIALFYGLLVGIFNGNSFYIILKDVCFFSFPIVVFYLLENYKEFIDNDFLKALFTYALIVSLMQIVFSAIGLFLHVNRPMYRHLFLLFSTDILPLVLVIRIAVYKRFFDIPNLIMIIAMLIVRSRTNLLFVFLLLFIYAFSLYFKGIKSRLSILLLIAIGFTFVWISPILFPSLKHFFGSSLKWRYQEWESLFVFLSNKTFEKMLIGNGFGATLPSLRPLNVFGGVIHFSLDRFHNVFLFLIFKLGVFGVVVYLFFFYLIMKKMATSLKDDSNFFLSFFVVFLLFVSFPANGGFFMSIFSGLILGVALFLNCYNISLFLIINEK